MATEQLVMAVIRAARPQFRRNSDKAAFALHATFVAAGYLLHATGPPALADTAFSISSRDEVAIDNWNRVEDNYGFVYSKSSPDRFSELVVVRCQVVNEKLMVNVQGCEYWGSPHIILDVGDYVGDGGGTNYSSQLRNLGKLGEIVNHKIFSRLGSGSWIIPDDPPCEGYIVPPLSGIGGGSMVVGRRFSPALFDPYRPPEPRLFGRNPPSPHP